MTVLYMNGFDYLTANTEIAARFTLASSTSYLEVVTGRCGIGKAVHFSSSSSYLTKLFSATNIDTVICGMAIYLPFQADTGYLMYFNRAASTAQCGIYINAFNQLSVRRGTTDVSALSEPLQGNRWYYLEAKFTITDAGSYEVRINGTAVLSGSADLQATTSSGADTLALGRYGTTAAVSQNVYYDDIYVCDNTAPNGDFLGDVRVAYLPANEDGACQFPRVGASYNYAAVDDIGNDGDTTYTYSNVVNAIDRYGVQNVSQTASIKALRSHVLAKKSDTGSRSIKTFVLSGSTQNDGPTVALSAAYAYDSEEYHQVDPNTAAAWTEAAVNGVQVGVQVAA